jgi:hypothetical protein
VRTRGDGASARPRIREYPFSDEYAYMLTVNNTKSWHHVPGGDGWMASVVRQGFVPCDRADDAVATDVSELRRAPAAGPDRARVRHNLAISLYSRFRCRSDVRDVDAAIVHARAVLRLMPLRNPDRPVVEGNLAMFLAGRRAEGDLREASVIAQRGLRPLPGGRVTRRIWLRPRRSSSSCSKRKTIRTALTR